MSRETLITRALSLIEELRQVSADELEPFHGQIGRLSKFYHKLDCDVECHRSIHTSPEHPICTTTLDDEIDIKANRHRRDIVELIRCSIDRIPTIHEAIWNYKQPEGSDVCFAARTLHLQNIATLQKRRLSLSAASPERLLTLCACMSIAKDFYNFEVQGGWQPKQTTIMERIRNKQSVAVQQMGKNVHRYIASQNTVLPSIRQKLDAALRVGIKLASIDDIGQEKGLPCLSLLFGFAFDKISRLSFSSLQYLHEELKAHPSMLRQVREFGTLVESWWSTCQETYHARFRDSAAATSAASRDAVGTSPRTLSRSTANSQTTSACFPDLNGKCPAFAVTIEVAQILIVRV